MVFWSYNINLIYDFTVLWRVWVDFEGDPLRFADNFGVWGVGCREIKNYFLWPPALIPNPSSPLFPIPPSLSGADVQGRGEPEGDRLETPPPPLLRDPVGVAALHPLPPLPTKGEAPQHLLTIPELSKYPVVSRFLTLKN